MKQILAVMGICGLCAVIAAATPIGTNEGGGVEVSGQLASSTAVDLFTFAFNGVGAVSVQSWGFGGAAVGQTLSGNAVDFSNLGSAVVGGFATNLALLDSGGNVIADAGQYFNGNPQACPSGNLNLYTFTCGDAGLNLSAMSAGDYTLAILSAPNDIAGGNLIDGFTNVGGVLGPGSEYSAQYLVDITGNVTLLPAQTNTVPEPATWMLLAGGLGLLGFWRKRRAAGLS